MSRNNDHGTPTFCLLFAFYIPPTDRPKTLFFCCLSLF